MPYADPAAHKASCAAYYAANKAKVVARQAKFYAENKEQVDVREARYHAAYRATHHEKLRAYYRENREVLLEKKATHAAAVLAKIRAYRNETREQRAVWQAAYDAAHKPQRAATVAKRRARRLFATPGWLTEEQHAEMRAVYALAATTGKHVDHIVPLQGKTVCGLHVPWNLQPLDPVANMSKGNRLQEAA